MKYKNKHPQKIRIRTSADRKMRRARNFAAITISDDASTNAGLAARRETVCTTLIDATRQHWCRRQRAALGTTSKRPPRALAQKSICAPSCPAATRQANIVAVTSVPLLPISAGGHVNGRPALPGRWALPRLPIGVSHQFFLPGSPDAAQPSSAAPQTSMPQRRPYQRLPRQRSWLSTILTTDHGGTGNDHDHTRGW